VAILVLAIVLASIAVGVALRTIFAPRALPTWPSLVPSKPTRTIVAGRAQREQVRS
jgi:hypothetical protein